MTDSKCSGYINDMGTQCPLASECHRFVTPKTIAESWYVPADTGHGCENYWPRVEE